MDEKLVILINTNFYSKYANSALHSLSFGSGINVML